MHAYYPPQYQPAMRQRMKQANLLMRFGRYMIRDRRLPPERGKRALDIGASNGFYLVELRNKGWEVHGVEVDAEAARYAREQYGLSIRTGAAEDVLGDFPDEHFDLVTMWHVLEHLFDPLQVLSEVRRILKPGGILMLELPNLHCLPSALFGKYWGYLDVPRHLYHFTPQTLSTMLAKAGLSLNGIRGNASPKAIAWSLRILRQRWTGNSQDFDSPHNPIFLTLIFPLTWIMARFRLCSEMSAVATKPA
jgi:2-polyprenyl-3-methyl-5-hydroxy-6-metoxy-1,4-benzoquinol methylase